MNGVTPGINRPITPEEEARVGRACLYLLKSFVLLLSLLAYFGPYLFPSVMHRGSLPFDDVMGGMLLFLIAYTVVSLFRDIRKDMRGKAKN